MVERMDVPNNIYVSVLYAMFPHAMYEPLLSGTYGQNHIVYTAHCDWPAVYNTGFYHRLNYTYVLLYASGIFDSSHLYVRVWLAVTKNPHWTQRAYRCLLRPMPDSVPVPPPLKQTMKSVFS